MPPSNKTIASFCEYTAEMLEGVSDGAELIKRHRAVKFATTFSPNPGTAPRSEAIRRLVRQALKLK